MHRRDPASYSNLCVCGHQFRTSAYLWRHILLPWAYPRFSRRA